MPLPGERPYYRQLKSNRQLKRDSKPRYLYHLSERKFEQSDGDNGSNGGNDHSVVLKPRDDSESWNRGDGEPPNKRICVSPSIPHCCTALAFSIPANGYSIYRTADKVKGWYPYGVPDAKITQERWLCSPTLFLYCGNIDIDDVPGWPHMLQNCGGSTQATKDEAREYLKKAKQAFKNYIKHEGVDFS